MIYAYIPSTRFAKKKYDASEDEVALEILSYFYSYGRGGVELVEAEVVDFINNHENDEYDGTLESPTSTKRRGGIGRVEKGGDFNEALEIFLRYINSKSWRKNKSLAWDF